VERPREQVGPGEDQLQELGAQEPAEAAGVRDHEQLENGAQQHGDQRVGEAPEHQLRERASTIVAFFEQVLFVHVGAAGEHRCDRAEHVL